MVAAQPKLRTNDLADEIGARYGSAQFYIERDLAVARLGRQIADVERLDRAAGLALKAHLASYLGDEDGVADAYRSLQRIGHRDVHALNIAMAYGKLGYYSAAQNIIRPFIKAESGLLSEFRDLAYGVGLYHHVHSEFDRAKAMNLEFANGGPTAAASRIQELLQRAGISDADLAAQMDAIGIVMRRHRRPVRKTSSTPIFYEPESLEMVTIRCLIEASPTELFQMNVDLAQVAEELGLPTYENLVLTFGAMSTEAQMTLEAPK